MGSRGSIVQGFKSLIPNRFALGTFPNRFVPGTKGVQGLVLKREIVFGNCRFGVCVNVVVGGFWCCLVPVDQVSEDWLVFLFLRLVIFCFPLVSLLKLCLMICVSRLSLDFVFDWEGHQVHAVAFGSFKESIFFDWV